MIWDWGLYVGAAALLVLALWSLWDRSFWGYPGHPLARLWRRLVDPLHRCECACNRNWGGPCGPCRWCRR